MRRHTIENRRRRQSLDEILTEEIYVDPILTVHGRAASGAQIPAQDYYKYREYDILRQMDLSSIRQFLEVRRELLTGRILDFGAGKVGTCREPQPYRYLVSPHAEYLPYDVGDQLPAPPFDCILSTQVMQMIPDPAAQIECFAKWLRPGGVLIITYPTNWCVIEAEDLFRFTPHGMALLVRKAGLSVGVNEERARVTLHMPGTNAVFNFPIGYGLVATKLP